MRIKRYLCIPAIVVGAFFMFAGTASAKQTVSAVTVNGGWTHLGGDPIVPSGIPTRNDFVRLMTSYKGSVAMTYAGVNASERSAVVYAARTGNFRSCQLRYGMTFQRMSFGINGTSVDRNVTFLDPRYRYKPAAAWCMDVSAGKSGPVLHLLVPVKCGNVAIINRTPAPKPTPKPTSPPTAGLVKTAQSGGVSVQLSGGEFTFDATIGDKGGSVQNGPSGTEVPLGNTIHAGNTLILCEQKPAAASKWVDFVPDGGPCQSHTFGPGEHFVFRFNNVEQLVTVLVVANADAFASATCPGGTTATASGHGHAEAWITVPASQLSAAQAAKYGDLFKQAKAEAAANAFASVTCGTATPTPAPPTPPAPPVTPPTPPANQPPMFISITVLNDVEIGQFSLNFCVTVTLANSSIGTLTFSPTFGRFNPPGSGPATISFSVSGGTSTRCSTYYAPTEVPPGGKDNIVVTIRDDTTGQSLQSNLQNSPPFTIKPHPVRP